MKKLLIICGLLFTAVTFASAQQGQGGQGGGQRRMVTAEERVKQLDEKVKLTDDQKTKATAVYTASMEDMKKAREEAGGDRQAMMEKMQKMRADVDTKITALLTDDQKKAYKTWQDEEKAQMEKRMKERQAAGGTN
jgi:protein CpxP